MMGHTPKSRSRIAFSKTTPTTAAGTNATNVALTIRRPSGSRPTTPRAISMSRFQYNRITARIAPDWIVIAYVSAASFVPGWVPT